MLPFTRIVAVAMAGVIVFAVLVPMALHVGNSTLAIALSVVFIVYLISNIVLMRRFPRR